MLVALALWELWTVEKLILAVSLSIRERKSTHALTLRVEVIGCQDVDLESTA